MQLPDFPRNTQGRDFVIGDLHGMFSMLEQALEDVAFNPRTDRLFSVGDLIDRGPESQRIVEFLEYPWFHACLGNHESVLLEYVKHSSAQLMLVWLRNGGSWFFQQSEASQRHIAEVIERHMPWSLSVKTNAGLMGMVHADLPDPCHWPDFVATLPEDPELQRLATWSRSRAYGEVGGEVTGVKQVFVGHSIVPTPVQVDNVWFIDTGAFRAGWEETHGTLTLAQIQPELVFRQF